MKIDFVTQEEMSSLNLKIDRILEVLEGRANESNTEWMKSSDVKKKLGCSDSTLINYRNSGSLPFSKIGGTYYYSEKDVNAIFTKSLTS